MEVDLLTSEDKINGLEEPSLNSFIVQGLEETWIGTRKTFILTCVKTSDGSTVKTKLGGLWSASVSPVEQEFPLIPLDVVRFGNDSAKISHVFPSSGEYNLWITITGFPIKNSPFKIKVASGSSNQIGKWPRIEEFIVSAPSPVIGTTAYFDEPPELVEFKRAREDRHPDALEFRNHLLSRADHLPYPSRIKEEVSKPLIVDITGNIAECDAESIFVSHNSWLEWPKENGYQAKIFKRLSEKERDLLLDKCSSFASGKLFYGSTMIFPISNISLPGQPPRQTLLVNTVTVLLKSRKKFTLSETKSKPYKTTKYASLKASITLSLNEVAKKGITSIAIPNQISKNFYSSTSTRNEDAVLEIIKEWAATNPKSELNTIFLVTKLPSPAPVRKKRLSLHIKK